jgi:threonine synthase
MRFVSTNDSSTSYSFKEAVQQNIPPSGGLFVPEAFEKTYADEVLLSDHLSLHELAFYCLWPYLEDDLTADQLTHIIQETFTFFLPVRPFQDSGIHLLELFHGPTGAFKDIGAAFMAGCLSLWNDDDRETTILVATSGDTGGAVANAFFDRPGFRVIILYPEGKVSSLQEMQIAGLGGNVVALAVDGTFDDCQRMVKAVFANKELNKRVKLVSANSINLARWLPQSVYYAMTWAYKEKVKADSILCVPSGNYGNISAAWLANLLGCTFDHIIAAHNANDTIPRFLHTGNYSPQPVIETLANAMDVSDPGNFVRLQYLMKNFSDYTQAKFNAFTVSDDDILSTIQKVWHEHQYLLDPHTASAWFVLEKHFGKGICVSTAHPGKFENVIRRALGFFPEEWMPEITGGTLNKTKIKAHTSNLEQFILAISR